MHRGVWAPQPAQNRSLLDLRVGLVGLGTVGRRLLDLLRPLGCAVTVYDPYLPADALAEWPAAHAGTLADVLRCPVVSIHAAQTPETFHLIDAAALAQLPEDQRTAIHLVFFAQMSYADAARVMKKSEKQVDNLLYRAKKALRGILEESDLLC